METKTVRLGDIAEIKTGPFGSALHNSDYVSNGIPIITVEHIGDLGIVHSPDVPRVNADDYERLSAYRLKTGDIVFSRVGAVDRTAIVRDIEDGWLFSGRLLRVRPDANVVDADFLNVYFSRPRFRKHMYAVANGSTMPSINTKILASVEIELPSMQSQKVIAWLFRQIDEKQIVNQQLSKNLLILAKLQFSSTFPNVHEGESRLSDVMENFDRKRIPLSRREREKRQGSYRYIGATSVLDYLDDYLFDGTYLLMGEDGTVQDENGFPILQYIWGRFWPNNHTHVLKGTIVSTEWLYLLLMNTNVRARVTGAVQQKISQTNMNSIPLTIPSDDKLSSFQKQIAPLFTQIKLLEEQNRNLVRLRTLLLPKLLSGEINLLNIETVMNNA